MFPLLNMTETITEKEADIYVEQGWIRAIALFEILGRPQSFVEEQVDKYIKNFAEHDIKLIKSDFDKTQEAGEDEHGKYYSVVGEVDFIVENLEKLLMIIIEFTPSHIEIIKPKKLTISDATTTRVINELIQKLNYFNQAYISATRQIDTNQKSLNLLAMNAAVLALMTGPKQLEDLSNLLGIREEQMVKVMLQLERKGIVRKEDKKYIFVKGVRDAKKNS